MVFCHFSDCINADKCGKFMTDEQEKVRRYADVPTWFYNDKPECYVKEVKNEGNYNVDF